MNEPLIFTAGIIVGIAAVFIGAVAIDNYRSWRYHFQRLQELSERPPVPMDIDKITLSRSDYPHSDDYWVADVYDKDDTRVAWDTDTHPMDAVLVAIEAIDRPA